MGVALGGALSNFEVVNTSELYFNSKKVFPLYNSPTQLTVNNVSFFSLKAGIYYFEVRQGTTKSNPYPVLAKPWIPLRWTASMSVHSLQGSRRLRYICTERTSAPHATRPPALQTVRLIPKSILRDPTARIIQPTTVYRAPMSAKVGPIPIPTDHLQLPACQ